MNKIALLALCLLVAALPFSALADFEQDFPFTEDPFEDRDNNDLETPDVDESQSIRVMIDGVSHTLVFDPSPEYSTVKDGMVQASFYEYDSDRNTLYELYLTFPEGIGPDTRVDANYAVENNKDCSVVLIVSGSDTELFYVSGVTDRYVYPENSRFSMDFDFAGGTDYAGTLDARLIALDLSTGAVLGSIQIDSAPFRFSMGGSSSDRHSEPLPTQMPSDLYKV